MTCRLQLLRNAAAEAGYRVMDEISISPRGEPALLVLLGASAIR